MKFIGRVQELSRLDRLVASSDGGLGVLWGRRRVGKTRLLLEWCARHQGLYTVADLSAPAIQRRYLAEAVASVLPGFDDVDYPDWRALLNRISTEARLREWRGPLIFDELPYWVQMSPDMPSILQRWIDHEARAANLVVMVAGSSQRMMQGLVLDASSPLYGRAREAFQLEPLSVGHIGEALHLDDPRTIVSAYTMWGGVPRYWELAESFGADIESALDHCMLDPAGMLHSEPDRLLIEELPPANTLRPVLDAVGLGAHKLTEIAGRIGQAPTALSRSLKRLQDMGLLRRDVPYGESERSGKRALYRIEDPFFRAWFRLVAPHRAWLAAAPAAEDRLSLWRKLGASLVAATWEDLCRSAVPGLADVFGIPWLPASRFWRGNSPEWDMVSRSADGEHILLGEVKWNAIKRASESVADAIQALLAKGSPPLSDFTKMKPVRAVFVPDAEPGQLHGVHIINARQVLDASCPCPPSGECAGRS